MSKQMQISALANTITQLLFLKIVTLKIPQFPRNTQLVMKQLPHPQGDVALL